MADVRVGIVEWNTADLLARCLDGLPAALGELDAEVVVVDNASADDSVAVVTSRPWVRLVRNDENAGYARAMNVALAGSAAPVLIALNPDTVLPPGSLAAAVACLRGAPGVGLVAPQLRNPDGSVQHTVHRFPSLTVALALAFVPRSWRARLLGRRLWLEGMADLDRAGDVDWAIGAVHVIRAEALDGAEPYSERWFMYVEDLELCWRLRQGGWRTRYEPSIEVEHVGNVAGAAAFGAARSRRYWAATYEFVAGARGVRYARLLAAANVVAVLVHLAGSLVGATLGPRSGRGAHRHQIGELRAALPAHVDAVVAGPIRAAAWTHRAP